MTGKPLTALVLTLLLAKLFAQADQVSVDCLIKIDRSGTNLVVSWRLGAECDTNIYLQGASDIGGPWTTLAEPPQTSVSVIPDTCCFFRVLMKLPAGAAQPAEVIQSVRDLAFYSRPQLNPETQFDIRLEPIRGLWEALQAQVVTVRESVAGQIFYESACIIRSGKAQYLGLSFGGFGLMSGLVSGSSFYFSYSWGSGIHRSQIGKQQVVDNKLRIWDTGNASGLDLFLMREPTGKIAVASGRFEGVNRWSHSAEFGVIDESDPASTKLVAPNGTLIATFAPAFF